VVLLASALRQGQNPDITLERLKGLCGVWRTTVKGWQRYFKEIFTRSVNYRAGLLVANRYGSFKALRQRWVAHCQSTLLKPVLLIDEAQHVSVECLTELRLLQSYHFDSQSLLFTILCGDNRLPERFRSADLLPLGSRIGPRLVLTPLAPEQLQDYLNHALDQAGNAHLKTSELMRTLAAHAAKNLRVLNQMAVELLAAGAQRNLPHIDESLFSELFAPTGSKSRRKPFKKQ
jgi:hypothetical protein